VRVNAYPSPAEVDDEFSVAAQTDDACIVLKLTGELDAFAAPLLSAELAAGGDLGWSTVIDLSDLTFIDSGGIHALIDGCAGRSVALVCPPGSVARVLEIVEIGRVVRVYERHDEALAAARSLGLPWQAARASFAATALVCGGKEERMPSAAEIDALGARPPELEVPTGSNVDFVAYLQ
jgi:anti-anti-sigma factor